MRPWCRQRRIEVGERWRGIRRWHRSRLSEEFRRKRGYGRGLVRGLAVSGSSVLRWSRWKGWDAHRDLMIRNQLGCPSASLPVERASNRPYVSRHFGDDLVNEQACPWIYSKDRTARVQLVSRAPEAVPYLTPQICQWEPRSHRFTRSS